MNTTNTLQRLESQTVAIQEQPYSAADVLQQVNLIQSIMSSVMKDGEHFGTIPGCGDKKTLLKSGAEKLGLTFRLGTRYTVQEKELTNGHREYVVSCELFHISSGRTWGQGVGSCTTMESKYRFRSEDTGKEVPSAYWDSRDKNLLGGSRFNAKKKFKDGKTRWTIVELVEHDNPADYYNTVLKMGKKRAHVDAILTATAASDIFTQDVEDIKENLAAFEDGDDGGIPREHPEPKSRTQRPANPPATTQDPFDPDYVPPAMGGDSWREVKIHFGKNNGTKLGDLDPQGLSWYMNKWEPREWPEGSGKFSDKDLALKAALAAAGREAGSK
jgi:hypothetical protein